MILMARGQTEILDRIDRDFPGYEVYYVEDTGTNTYTTTEITREAHFFEISNTGNAPLNVEINNDGFVYTVYAGKGFGALGKLNKIEKVVVTATDMYTLLIRE